MLNSFLLNAESFEICWYTPGLTWESMPVPAGLQGASEAVQARSGPRSQSLVSVHSLYQADRCHLLSFVQSDGRPGHSEHLKLPGARNKSCQLRVSFRSIGCYKALTATAATATNYTHGARRASHREGLEAFGS